jgi:hypothetical protein
MNKKQSLALASTSLMAAGVAHGSYLWSGSIDYEIPGTGSIFYSQIIDLQNVGTENFQVRFDGYNSPGSTKPFVSARSGDGASANAWTLSTTNMDAGTNIATAGAPLTGFGTNIGMAYAAQWPPAKTAYLCQNYQKETVGQWPDNANTEGYVGVELNDGAGNTNYAWVHLIYQAANINDVQLEVVDYCYQTTPNVPIIAGVTNDPGAPVFYYSSPSSTNGDGAIVQMTVTAIGAPPPTLQWQAAGTGGVYTNLPENAHFVGTTSNILTIAGCNAGDQLNYQAVAANSLGTATSAPAYVTVKPVILVGPNPPQAQVFAGQTAHFNIAVQSGLATGYQWQFKGANITDGAKYSGTATTSLVISNLAAGDAGSYDVVVMNAGGPVASTNSTLTVVATNGGFYELVQLADGPVDYYRLNETGDPSTNGLIAFDNVGEADGVYGADVQNGFDGVMGPSVANGWPGIASGNTAAAIQGGDTNSVVTLPPWNLNTNTVTITAWIDPTNGIQPSGAGVVYTRSTNSMVCGMAFHGGLDANGLYDLGFNWNDQQGAWNWTSGLEVPTNQWSFAAVVITPTNATVYVINNSGIHFAVDPNITTNAVQAWNDVEYIGCDPKSGLGAQNFQGVISDVGIFNHSLTTDQVYDLYAASVLRTNLPPTLSTQPASEILYAGQTARFSVAATGSSTLTNQWSFNGSPLSDNANVSGSASPALTIRDVSGANAGNYTLRVSNPGGATNSMSVSLSIRPNPTDAYGATALSVAGTGTLAAYYALNETSDPAAGGVLAYDYAGDFDGAYGTGVTNGFAGIMGPLAADGFPGFGAVNYAAQFTVSNANPDIVCPPMNLNTNAVTITAWINPAAYQHQFAGVVFARGGATVAGLDFPTTNSAGQACLGYQWTGDISTYGWNSTLVPPTNQWSFVALVLNPATTNATIWMINTNGSSSASHYTTDNLIMMAFDSGVHIGNDSESTSGADVFNGEIDEVGIYTAALSAAQIQTLYNAGLGMVNVSIKPVSGGVQISWPAGTLLQAPNLAGPWTTNSAASPYTVAPTVDRQFYRVVN